MVLIFHGFDQFIMAVFELEVNAKECYLLFCSITLRTILLSSLVIPKQCK